MAGQPDKRGTVICCSNPRRDIALSPTDFPLQQPCGTRDARSTKIEENTAAQIALDLFEGLVWLDGKGKVQPAQAESWKVSADGKQIDFTLRKNLRWSDGSALTADDLSLRGSERLILPQRAHLPIILPLGMWLMRLKL